MPETIIDVTEEVKTEIVSSSTILAQRKGLNVLILKPIEPRKRFDKKTAHFLLEYRWLSREDVHCVQGSDYILLTKKEMQETQKQMDTGKTLFDCFNLF